MEIYNIDCLDRVNFGEYNVNSEQRRALESSFVQIQNNYKFSSVMFWGKIVGHKADYLIAMGKGQDQWDIQFLYSNNAMDWYLLPPSTALLSEKVSKVAKGIFTGDPSCIYKAEGNTDTLTEEDRLAVIVNQINTEAAVVPRGAYLKRTNGQIQVNPSFKGLSYAEAEKLDNFYHFCESAKKKSMLEMSLLNPTIDFMDALTDDKYLWSYTIESSNAVVIRSLVWLGLTFFHVPNTPLHGYVYMGDGRMNLYHPFMI